MLAFSQWAVFGGPETQNSTTRHTPPQAGAPALLASVQSVVEAHFVSGSAVVCEAPALPPGAAFVEASRNQASQGQNQNQNQNQNVRTLTHPPVCHVPEPTHTLPPGIKTLSLRASGAPTLGGD